MYDIVVRATETGTGFASTGGNTTGIAVALRAVTGVTAQAGGGAGQISVTSWADPNPANSVSGYTVNATPLLPGYPTITSNVNYPVNTAMLSGAVGGVSYTATVRAVGSGGDAPQSATSAAVLVVGDAGPPSTPPTDVTETFEITTAGGQVPGPGTQVTITGSGQNR